MSIQPSPFEPGIFRSDPNQTTNQLMNKIDEIQKSEQNKIQQKTSCMKTWSERGNGIVENLNFQILITIFTVGSLFMEDIRIIFLDISSDNAVDLVNIIFIVVFMIEILLSLSIPNYFCSFFFFLDVVSTLSIIMDISMLTNYFSQSTTLTSGVQLSTIIRNSKASRAAARTVRVMKIFRLARIVKIYKSATKAKQLKSKRIKEEVQQKLQRMKQNKKKQVEKQEQILISYRNIESQVGGSSRADVIESKLSKMTTMKQSTGKIKNCQKELNTNEASQKISVMQINSIKEKKGADSIGSENIEQLKEKISKKQSKISKLLSDSTMKKIIIVILLIMFSVPGLDIDNYFQQQSAWDFLADFVAGVLARPEIPIEKINILIERTLLDLSNLQDTSQQLIIFKSPFKQLYSYDSGTFSNQRINDLLISQTNVDVNRIMQVRNLTLIDENQSLDKITIIFSCKTFNKIDSWFSIGKIIFICLGIIYLLHILNQSITQMITQPIERMLEDVKNNGKEDYFEQASTNEQNNKKKINEAINYETTNVHFALNKISRLISKFFGVRGKQFIYRKIFQPGTITSNYLSQNRKVFCIIALCNIDNYYHISKILKEDIIQLNNQVAEYLHSSVFRYGGSGLVNHEGSFLVVFQCPTEYENLLREKEQKTKVRKYKQLKNYNLRMGQSMRKVDKLLKPRYHGMSEFNAENEQKAVKLPKIQNNYINILADFSVFALVKTMVKINKQAKFYKYKKDTRLVNQLGDNFQINVNCMLHAGWIHEGFIGSNLKMNFSYFGQVIEQVQRLSYHSSHLIGKIALSNNVYDLITSGMKRYTRIAERYLNKKTNSQQFLYIVDLNLQSISPPKNIFDKKHRDPAVISLKKILNFQTMKDQEQIKNYKAETFINSKKQLRQVMKNVISEQFRRKYNLAYEHYMFGQISQCRQLLDQLSNFNKDDILVQLLYSTIQSLNKNQSKISNIEDFFQFI